MEMEVGTAMEQTEHGSEGPALILAEAHRRAGDTQGVGTQGDLGDGRGGVSRKQGLDEGLGLGVEHQTYPILAEEPHQVVRPIPVLVWTTNAVTHPWK